MKTWKIAAVGAALAIGAGTVVYVAAKGLQGRNLLAEFRKLGDVNGDGVINEGDVVLIETAMYSVPGVSNWNPNADLNGDGVVDVGDLNICLGNFGLTFAKWRATMGYATRPLKCPSCRSYTVQTAIVPIKEI